VGCSILLGCRRRGVLLSKESVKEEFKTVNHHEPRDYGDPDVCPGHSGFLVLTVLQADGLSVEVGDGQHTDSIVSCTDLMGSSFGAEWANYPRSVAGLFKY